MNVKLLLAALLMFAVSSCTIQPKVILYNNADEAITISFADDSYRIDSGRSRTMQLYFVREFQVQVGATSYSYDVDYWPDEYAYFTGWWLFADRRLKAQFNADGRIFVLTEDQSPPISAVANQPRGFPLLSSVAFAECPKWADADENCPIVGPHEDILREFYFKGTSEAHLVGILVHAGPEMVPSIIEVIGDRKMFARRYAISALGLLKQREALPALTSILTDKSEKDYFRSDALQAIYVIDPDAGQIAASELLNDPNLPDGILKQAAIDVLEHPERIPQEWRRH